ncbi:MAG: hypothetical protein DRP00_03600 [Candidatus Aenigmatarchaeota archaeon]|nr:MAG: hypothetical protein DRP00_03600 [Candidatus Aenigmarchaeota archaeon]
MNAFLAYPGKGSVKMSREDLLINISANENIGKDAIEKVNEFAERLDFLDIQILRKFYMTGREFPNDLQPYCFPILYKEMKAQHKLKIGMEALRKRLNNLVKLGLLEKIKHSNPTNYGPVRGKENFVRAIILKFFIINGLTRFL